MYPYLSLVFNLHLFVLASSRYLFVSHSLSVWLFLRNNNFFFIDQRAFRSIIFMVSFFVLRWQSLRIHKPREFWKYKRNHENKNKQNAPYMT